MTALTVNPNAGNPEKEELKQSFQVPKPDLATKNGARFFGYKSLILASSEPLIVPLAWQVISANLQKVNHLIPVISQAGWLLGRDKKYELIADSGFDAGYNYDWCKELNIRFTCPLNMANKLKWPRLKKCQFYKSKLGQKLYQRRTDIERLNGHLKDIFLIDHFPIRRLKNVNIYLNLAMLCYLAGVYYNLTQGRKLREIKSLIAQELILEGSKIKSQFLDN